MIQCRAGQEMTCPMKNNLGPPRGTPEPLSSSRMESEPDSEPSVQCFQLHCRACGASLWRGQRSAGSERWRPREPSEGKAVLFSASLTLEIMKSRKHHVGKGGPSWGKWHLQWEIRACASVRARAQAGVTSEWHVDTWTEGTCGGISGAQLSRRPEKDLKLSHSPLSYWSLEASMRQPSARGGDAR